MCMHVCKFVYGVCKYIFVYGVCICVCLSRVSLCVKVPAWRPEVNLRCLSLSSLPLCLFFRDRLAVSLILELIVLVRLPGQ